jgi:hypothetical protein
MRDEKITSTIIPAALVSGGAKGPSKNKSYTECRESVCRSLQSTLDRLSYLWTGPNPRSARDRGGEAPRYLPFIAWEIEREEGTYVSGREPGSAEDNLPLVSDRS